MHEAGKVLAEAKLQVVFLLVLRGLECYLEEGDSVVAVLLLALYMGEGFGKGDSQWLVLLNVREIDSWVRAASRCFRPLLRKYVVRSDSGGNPSMYK